MSELHWIEKVLRLTAIDDNGCWRSSYAITNKGYSRVWVDGENIRVHRLSYQMFRGQIPEGMMVCHTCDVRNCWNPDHLFLGTAQDNYHDMVRKGRRSPKAPGCLKGTGIQNSILDEAKVIEIRRRNRSGESYSVLAKEFGIHKSTISQIMLRKTWAHVQDDITHAGASSHSS